jgi:hypothetical protein
VDEQEDLALVFLLFLYHVYLYHEELKFALLEFVGNFSSMYYHQELE